MTNEDNVRTTWKTLPKRSTKWVRHLINTTLHQQFSQKETGGATIGGNVYVGAGINMEMNEMASKGNSRVPYDTTTH